MKKIGPAWELNIANIMWYYGSCLLNLPMRANSIHISLAIHGVSLAIRQNQSLYPGKTYLPYKKLTYRNINVNLDDISFKSILI